MTGNLTTVQLAKHVREVFFGGNWTFANFQDMLSDVTLEEAVAQVHSFNTIATLVQDVTYYMSPIIDVLNGGPLTSKDELSFAHPVFENEEAWRDWLAQMFQQVEELALLIEQVPDDKFASSFSDEKYGNHFRNLFGFVEHAHYHLGQIALIKKLLRLEK